MIWTFFFFQKKTYKWPICKVEHHYSLGKYKLRPQWDITLYLLGWFLPKWQELRMWRKQIPFIHCCWVYKLVLPLWGKKKCMMVPKKRKKDYNLSYNMIKQYYYWVHIQRNQNQYLKQITAHPFLLQHHSQ